MYPNENRLEHLAVVHVLAARSRYRPIRAAEEPFALAHVKSPRKTVVADPNQILQPLCTNQAPMKRISGGFKSNLAYVALLKWKRFVSTKRKYRDHASDGTHRSYGTGVR